MSLPFRATYRPPLPIGDYATRLGNTSARLVTRPDKLVKEVFNAFFDGLPRMANFMSLPAQSVPLTPAGDLFIERHPSHF
jgi:hypothetical protein